VPDDILDAAQKAINDAAKNADAGAVPAAPLNETPAPQSAPLPPEPVEPVTPPPAEMPQSSPVTPETPASTDAPTTPTQASTDMTKEEMMNELLGSTSVAAPASVVVPPPEKSGKPHSGSLPPKKTSKVGIIAVIAALLLTLPVAVYFISQQNSQIADIRNRSAWDTVYQGFSVSPDSCKSLGPGWSCHCQNGTACTHTECEYDIERNCRDQGRQYCLNVFNGNAMTCCVEGYVCGPSGGCVPGGGGGDDDSGDDDDTEPTPTPTTGITPVCQNIKLYKNGTQVTDLNTLRAGDEVVLAVKGNLSPTKAHFRVNGSGWTETTTKNASDEFTWSYTIPEGVPDFVIEGEVFTNGAWR